MKVNKVEQEVFQARGQVACLEQDTTGKGLESLGKYWFTNVGRS